LSFSSFLESILTIYEIQGKAAVNQDWLALPSVPVCQAGLVGCWYKGSQLKMVQVYCEKFSAKYVLAARSFALPVKGNLGAIAVIGFLASVRSFLSAVL
jgi:hypothetical protein